MQTLIILVSIVLAYLLGSISSAILICRRLYGTDIRNYGSGNPGANNVRRIYGLKAGIIVFVCDFIKGLLAVSLAYLSSFPPDSEEFVSLQIVLGLCAVLGHIFPVFFGFKGGKGVAVVCGILTALHPWAMIVCFLVFLISFLISRYISLSVLIAVLFYPILINSVFALWLIPDETLTLKIFSLLVMIIIWLSHLSNLRRIAMGEEEKVYFSKKSGQ